MDRNINHNGSVNPKSNNNAPRAPSIQPTKRLTPQEIREKIDKELCLLCDEKYITKKIRGYFD